MSFIYKPKTTILNSFENVLNLALRTIVCGICFYLQSVINQKVIIKIFSLQGPLTAPHAINLIEESLRAEDEKSLDILFYRKNGE